MPERRSSAARKARSSERVVFAANVSFPTAGTQSLFAQFVGGNANYVGSTSATVKVTVVATVGSTTTLTPSATSVTKGSVVTLTAAVASGGQPVTRGAVLFCNAVANNCEDGAVLGKAQLTAGGTAAIKLVLTVGFSLVKAVLAGTALIGSSSSTAQTITVTVTNPTTTTLSRNRQHRTVHSDVSDKQAELAGARGHDLSRRYVQREFTARR